jgi:hypothetical protein
VIVSTTLPMLRCFRSVIRIWIGCGLNQISGSGSDSESGPDPGGQKMTHEKIKKFHVLKCWMFSFDD